MNHLRFLENNTEPGEFYIDDLKALYLKDIKQLTLIVGANNARKSRFIRKIIGLENKVLIRFNGNLNKVIQEMPAIFEGIEQELMKENLITLSFSKPSNETFEYKAIKGYSENRTGSTQVRFEDIRLEINEFIAKLSKITEEELIVKLHSKIVYAHEVFKFILLSYKNFPKTHKRFSDGKKGAEVEGIGFDIPTNTFGVSQFDEKVELLEKAVAATRLLQELDASVCNSEMIYIPALRAARRLEGVSTNVFEKTLRTQHNLISNNIKLKIETGLDLYDKIEAARSGHRAERDNFLAFEKFISEVFFQNKEIDIVAVKSEEKILKICITGELDDVPIHDLGDGVQGIISLVLPIFTAQANSWIFIDEPENHLHPGFQNIFIRAIADNKVLKAKNLRFFITTHSNHVLAEALLSNMESEILVFSKKDKDASNIVAFNGNEYNTLEMLGVLNTSVLVSNCSIWVEGITDRLYLRSFLSAYDKVNPTNEAFKPAEGFNYSFVEYGGNNLVHYDFDHQVEKPEDPMAEKMRAYFLNTNIFLLADTDFEKNGKHEYYEKIKRSNFRYFQTEQPEIENLIPNQILKSWLTSEYKCDKTEVEDCFTTPNKDLKLGAYLDGKITYGNGFRKFSEPNKGGTLRSNYKSSLAAFVHAGVAGGSITWDDLKESETIVDLVEQLVKFIKEKNQKSG